MTTILPIAAIGLALIAAGCVAYIGWEITRQALNESPDDDSPDDESGDS